jgi:hypothetical protein
MEMLHLVSLSMVLTATSPAWHTDYDKATQEAMRQRKDLVVCFYDGDNVGDLWKNADVQKRLQKFVCLKVPASYKYGDQRLLDHTAFREMSGKGGIAVIRLADASCPNYQTLISAHPFVASRYRWAPNYGSTEVCTILDMPAWCSLSQRSMIFAVKVHPERPRSIECECHPALMGHAQRHSITQASMQNQHHANLIAVSSRLQGEAGIGFGSASEVVAESWGNFVGGENVLEAAFSCVDAWRQSPGHWGAVSRTHRVFGYDIAKGANGTWYATGIFAQ